MTIMNDTTNNSFNNNQLNNEKNGVIVEQEYTFCLLPQC